jgi:hypothetical protein
VKNIAVMRSSLKSCAMKTQAVMQPCEWQFISKINSQVIHNSYPDLWTGRVRNLCKIRGKSVDDRWITGENSDITHTPPGYPQWIHTRPVHKKWAVTCGDIDLHRIHSPYYYYSLLPIEIQDQSRCQVRLGKTPQNGPSSGIPWMRATANIRQEESA